MRSGPIKELLRTRESLFHQMPKVLYKTHLATKVQRLFSKVGLLYNPISQGIQVLTLILNLIDTSLSLFHSFTATFLSWLGKWDLLCEMRPKCGPFHQFGPHADQTNDMVRISHKRSHFLNYERTVTVKLWKREREVSTRLRIRVRICIAWEMGLYNSSPLKTTITLLTQNVLYKELFAFCWK